jgi:hypothetical protein
MSSLKPEYQGARDAAAEELAELLTTQKKTEQRIVQLRQTIASLDALAGRRIIGESEGLTDAIRSIFKALPEKTSISGLAIKRKLLNIGFAESQYSNFMSSVHVVLSRLEERGEIRRFREGKALMFTPVIKDFLEGL